MEDIKPYFTPEVDDDISINSSELMTCKSVVDYVSSISTIPSNTLRTYSYIYEDNDNIAVNLETTFNILDAILFIGFGTRKTMPSFIEPKVACSYNTLKDLYNYVFAGKTWNIKRRFSEMQYNKHYRSLGSMKLTWSLVGGGSGGSGAPCGYTAKNAPHTIWGSRGVAGGNTVCEYTNIQNEKVTVTARGGAATEYSYLRASKNNGWSYGNGNNGNNGERLDTIFHPTYIFPFGRDLIITCGYGGGGGGAVAGYRGDVGKGSSGADGNGSNGGNATQFGTSEAGVWGGGGGGNANNVSSAGSYNGQRKAQSSQTPQKYFGQYTKGSNTASVGSNPNGMGGGGRAGLRDSPQPALNGGEGGNSGGVINNGTENVFFNQLD